ncbi:hypothetical protein KD909_07260 [Exiguobacterium sp. PFWT01]|uniref:hypothetical protein n=1 Tax=Exiguobacterium sp. PFWT01 TaxID=2829816 RepID=UPI001BADC37C|nr:hypothetical protein [Exiguobacterium sp. PFWT01]QUP88507.1 hypothetical protein KD909_07260 [Exiguobacterium sp. PFWT01]
MMKRMLLMLSTVGILSGCAGEQMDVVKLDYMPEQWNVGDLYANQMDADSETWSTAILGACTGEPLTQIEGDVTVFNSYAVNRKVMISDYDPSSYKLVTFLKGKENYTICYDGDYSNMRLGKIDELPDFLDLSAGIEVPNVPMMKAGTKEEEEVAEKSEASEYLGMPINLFKDTMVHLTSPLNGAIALTVGDQEGIFPISFIEPYNAQMGTAKIALGYNDKLKAAHFYFETENGTPSVQPFLVLNEKEWAHEPIQFEELQVERVLQTDTLEPGVKTPLYIFSYMKNGKRVEEEVSLTYTKGEFATNESIKESTEAGLIANPSVPRGPFFFLHKNPLDVETTLNYPDTLRAAGTDMSDLMNAFKEAEPVDRAGEVGEYPLLTIIDGWKGQEFQLSFKKRSKKVDVYVTDETRDQTFKLSSAGAETFFSYFPDLDE